MTSSYQWHIKRCKSPKAAAKVKRIVDHLLIGIRKEYPTAYMAKRLNTYGVWTLMSKSWTPFSLQMQLLKMQRMDHDSSLAWGLADALNRGEATKEDLDLLSHRVKHWTH